MGFVTKELGDFLGKGITFPIKLTNGRAPLESGFELIKASIIMILSWEYGKRFFLSEFGSKLNQLIQQLNKVMIEDGKFQEITSKLAATIETLEKTTNSFDETTSKLNDWVKTEKNFKEAIDSFERVIEINPNDVASAIYLKRAKYYLENGIIEFLE